MVRLSKKSIIELESEKEVKMFLVKYPNFILKEL